MIHKFDESMLNHALEEFVTKLGALLCSAIEHARGIEYWDGRRHAFNDS